MVTAVGIDLSGISRRTKGRTVAVRLDLDPLRYAAAEEFPNSLASDRLLIDWVVAQDPKAVAIDAPLTLPHSVTCEEAACTRCQPGHASYLERDVDREARRRGGAMPLVMLAAIAFRGAYLARQLRTRGVHVVETYPAASFRELGAGKDPEARLAALRQQIAGLPDFRADALDAACAALAATQWGAQVISRAGGVIVLASPRTTPDDTPQRARATSEST